MRLSFLAVAWVCWASFAPAAEPARYPELELVLHWGVVFPTEGDDTLAAVGPIAGITPLVRVSSPFAFGLIVEHSRLAWRAAGPRDRIFAEPGDQFPDDEGSMSTTIVAPAVRWYFLGAGEFAPHLDLAIGWGSHVQLPDHPDCSVEEPFAARLAAGIDVDVASWARLGASVAAFPFALGQGCTGIAYEGQPPSPPFPGLGIAAVTTLTTVWGSR